MRRPRGVSRCRRDAGRGVAASCRLATCRGVARGDRRVRAGVGRRDHRGCVVTGGPWVIRVTFAGDVAFARVEIGLDLKQRVSYVPSPELGRDTFADRRTADRVAHWIATRDPGARPEVTSI